MLLRSACTVIALWLGHESANSDAIIAFRTQATRHWCRALRRRSQRDRLDWERMNRPAN
jgi:hypothetical protein